MEKVRKHLNHLEWVEQIALLVPHKCFCPRSPKSREYKNLSFPFLGYAKHSLEVCFLPVQAKLMLFQAKIASSTVFISVRKFVQATNLGTAFSPFTVAHRIVFALPQKIFRILGLRTFFAIAVIHAASTSHLDYYYWSYWSLPISLPLLQYPLFSAATLMSQNICIEHVSPLLKISSAFSSHSEGKQSQYKSYKTPVNSFI